MPLLRLIGTATATTDRNATHPGYAEAELDFSVQIPDDVSSDTVERVRTALAREADRLAVICAVDLRDQQVNQQEAERVKALPKERPTTVLGAGSKDPKNRQQFDAKGNAVKESDNG
jgi:hypothetical protein